MMNFEKIKISSLIEDPSNARKHDEKNLSAIKGSLAKFGQQKPIVVTKDNIIIAGNGTYRAAKSLGWQEIDIVRTELSGTEAIAYAIADNRSGELAAWEDEILSKTLEALKSDGFDLAEIGFDDEDLSQWLKAPDVIPGCDEDEVPEVEEPKTKPGDLYILGDHRLLCGDSTNVQHVEMLMGGEKADMVFTDPPYGVGYKYNSHNDDVTQEEHYKFLCGLLADPCMYAPSGRWIITPGCYNLAAMCKARKDFSHIGCWTKTNAMSPGRVTHFWTWEPIFFYGKFKRKRGNDVFNYPVGKQPDTGDHTCPKPIALWQDIVENFSETKDKILDLFLGSGSTLIACEKTGRRCFGMEIDPHYCDIIVARWEKYSNKKAILQSGTETGNGTT